MAENSNLVARLHELAYKLIVSYSYEEYPEGLDEGHLVREAADELDQLRSVALAAKALVQSAHACLASDDPEHDETSVSEPELVALESALEAAGYGMSEEEMTDG